MVSKNVPTGAKYMTNGKTFLEEQSIRQPENRYYCKYDRRKKLINYRVYRVVGGEVGEWLKTVIELYWKKSRGRSGIGTGSASPPLSVTLWIGSTVEGRRGKTWKCILMFWHPPLASECKQQPLASHTGTVYTVCIEFSLSAKTVFLLHSRPIKERELLYWTHSMCQ